MVCGRVPKFGFGICLSRNMVPEFNYFLKFQVFKYFNPCGLVPAKVVPQNEILREEFLKTLAVPARKSGAKILPPK